MGKAGTGVVGTRGEDGEPTLLGGTPSSCDRGVDEGHIRATVGGEASDSLCAGDPDRAHLRPDRPGWQRREQALVVCDREHGVGVGDHRDRDPCGAGSVAHAGGDAGAPLGQCLGARGAAVPHDGGDPRPQQAPGHAVAHRADTQDGHGRCPAGRHLARAWGRGVVCCAGVVGRHDRSRFRAGLEHSWRARRWRSIRRSSTAIDSTHSPSVLAARTKRAVSTGMTTGCDLRVIGTSRDHVVGERARDHELAWGFAQDPPGTLERNRWRHGAT